MNVGYEEVQKITFTDIKKVLSEKNNNKTPGEMEYP